MSGRCAPDCEACRGEYVRIEGHHTTAGHKRPLSPDFLPSNQSKVGQPMSERTFSNAELDEIEGFQRVLGAHNTDALTAAAAIRYLRSRVEEAERVRELFKPLQWVQGWDGKVVDDPELLNIHALLETLHDPDEPITQNERKTLYVIVDALRAAIQDTASTTTDE